MRGAAARCVAAPHKIRCHDWLHAQRAGLRGRMSPSRPTQANYGMKFAERTTYPRVKICCILSVAEAALAIRHGAAALGLVSAMPSGPGVIAEETIAEIAATVPLPPEDKFSISYYAPQPRAVREPSTSEWEGRDRIFLQRRECAGVASD